jgi:hypothetical protein
MHFFAFFKYTTPLTGPYFLKLVIFVFVKIRLYRISFKLQC